MSFLRNGIGKKAYIWDEIAEGLRELGLNGIITLRDIANKELCQFNEKLSQNVLIVKQLRYLFELRFDIAKRNVIYTILNSENVNEVSQVSVGVPHGSLGHQKEIANLILGKLALET